MDKSLLLEVDRLSVPFKPHLERFVDLEATELLGSPIYEGNAAIFLFDDHDALLEVIQNTHAAQAQDL